MNGTDDRAVLVVDDEVDIRDAIATWLSRSGMRVCVANDTPCALEIAKVERIAVAVVDKNLPGHLDGIDLLRQMPSISPITKVIILTGYATIDSTIQALRLGAFDYIKKPVDLSFLEERVERALEAASRGYDQYDLLIRHNSLFETFPGVVWFMTDNGVIRRINQRGAEQLGYESNQLIGRSYEKLLARPDSSTDAMHWAFKERRTGTRATRRQVVRLKTAEGELRLFEVYSTGGYSEHTDPSQRQFWGTVGVAFDITEWAELQEELQRTQKMEAVGRLAGGIAHDFNNLLTVILSNPEFIRDAVDLPEGAATALQEIEDAAKRAAGLTSQLLAFSRRKAQPPRVIDANAVLLELEPLLTRLLGEDLELDVKRDPALNRVKADPSQLEQIMVNLAVNARDAMPQGGTLSILTQNVKIEPEFAKERPGLDALNYVLLAVSDTGQGMSPEVRQRIFEPFFTTKQATGTGLGMATVYGVVQQLGGYIAVYSEQQMGTTIKVYLPITQEPLSPEDVVDTPQNEHGGHGKVLIVEDEELVRRAAKRILLSEGFEVLEASNGGQGLSAVQESGDTIDIVLTDMVMPEVNGAELAKKIQELQPGMPIVFMSGYLGDISSRHPDVEKDTPFLQKPFSRESLLKALRVALDKKR